MHKLNKKQKRALRNNWKREPRNKKEHRHRISRTLNSGRTDFSVPKYHCWSYKW